MKKKIEQLLSGKFQYEQPALLFSQEKIAVTVKPGETLRGELYFGTEDNERIRGYITSSHRRLVPGMDRFSGTTVCLPYGIDGGGMQPGEECTGWLCFTTNIGEYKLPFAITVEKEQVKSSSGEIKDMDAFQRIAGENFREAYRIFTDRSFAMILKDSPKKEQALYKGLSIQPVTYQHLEEFFIGTGRKEPIRISLEEEQAEFYEMRQSIQESFAIRRNGWGHLRLEIETRGDFLEVGKKVVTEEDFIGSQYQAEYVIRQELLGKGTQFGEIIVQSPYQRLVYHVVASKGPRSHVNMNIRVKKHRVSMMRDYLDYRTGKMEFKTWAGSSHYILNQLWEAGCDYPEYQMYEAYLLHLEGDDEAAGEILKKFQDKSFSREELEFAGMYLYLCTLTGLYPNKEQALRRVQNFFHQKEDSFLLLWLLLQMEPSFRTAPSKALFMMEEIFDKGSRSPLLYLEAWRYIEKDMSLLHRLDRFWIQVFLLAGKEGLLTEELSMRLAYLSGYEKTFSQSLYRALGMAYEAYPTDDALEAICKYIMKGNPRKQEYFRWYSLAVEHGLRLTRLYEYYIETMDTSYQQELPKAVLMYFTYNNDSLGDGKKAFLYASVIRHKEKDPGTYARYKNSMEEFAAKKLAEGCMNENYAALYQEFLMLPDNVSKAKAIAGICFTCRLYCDDKKIRKVIVRHAQLDKEEVYPCVHGVAYPRIYTEDAAILFQDDKQRRYASTVAYNISRLFDERNTVPVLIRLGINDPGILLHYCESTAISKDNLGIFQKLVKSSGFASEYRRHIRKKILDYYKHHVYGEDLDDHLKNIDFREYALVDRPALLEILIARHMFPQALGIIEEFGYEGVSLSDLLKLTSRMILRSELSEDEELLALASEVYRQGKYDEVILEYLMKYRTGPIEELLSIWKSAQGFDMDTYQLEEKILELLMFSCDYRKEGETVLKDYVKKSGKERIIGAYLTQVSYGIFVKEYPMSDFVKKELIHAYKRKWPVNQVCRMALLLSLSREKHKKGDTLEMKRKLLEEFAKKGMIFALYRRLEPDLLSPYQLDDKTFVECHAHPKAKVTLYYALDAGLGLEREYKSEPLANVFEGIFTKAFTLFYGESLHYYFVIEKDGQKKKTSERVITMNKVEGTPGSKYQMLNQILAARRLEKEQEVLQKMKQYLRQEQYVKELFVTEKEE